MSYVSITCVESGVLKGLCVWNYDLFLEYRDLAGKETREAEGDHTYSVIRI